MKNALLECRLKLHLIIGHLHKNIFSRNGDTNFHNRFRAPCSPLIFNLRQMLIVYYTCLNHVRLLFLSFSVNLQYVVLLVLVPQSFVSVKRALHACDSH